VTAPRGPARSRLGVSGLSKRFGPQLVLNDVAIRLRDGEVHGLAGHNGSGKSTLIKCLAGYHTPEPGAFIHLDGGTHAWEHAPASWSKRLRFLHQDLGLVAGMNAIENFALAGGYARRRPLGIDWQKQRERTEVALDRLGVDLDVRAPVVQLSAVDRTMLALARAFDGLPADGLLVLDEPTAALTGHEAEPLFRSIRRVVAHGATVLLVTHHLDELITFANRVTVLREGRVALEAPVPQVTRSTLATAVAGTPTVATNRRVTGRPPTGTIPRLVIRDLQGGRLQPFSLEVHPGEIVGIGGLTGSGRDDAAPLVVGQSAPAAGQVRVDDIDIAPGDPRSATRNGIAYAPADRQARALFPQHSAGENVTLPGLVGFRRFLRIDRRAERSAAQSSLSDCQIQPADPERPILQFSGGNQQKAVLARCFRSQPRVLLLDEPTQGVDVGARAAIYQLIRRAAAQDVAVLVCSSDDDELAELCDRVVVLVHGHTAAELTGAALTANHLSHASLGEAVTLERS